MTARFLDGRVRVSVGDITRVAVDAVVNAANRSLLGGGGVDGAIHRAGGPAILAECRELRRTRYPDGLPTGEAVLTTAGELPARHVIHTVGPIWNRDPQPAVLLALCYRNSLRIAVEAGVTRVAFPSISTGAFGYPRVEAAQVASQALESALLEWTAIEQVELVFFSADDATTFTSHQRFSSRLSPRPIQ